MSTNTLPSPFQISDLAGFRHTVVGYSHDEGYQIVTSIVEDTAEEADAALAAILADSDYDGWVELYTLAWDAADWALSYFITHSGHQIR